MPKKAKKGKKGKKGKGKGGKKAKKDASIKSLSEANSKMWETRLEITEQSLNEYRANARKLLIENDTLQSQVSQTEKDTIDVITYLKRQDQEKDKQMEKLSNQMRDLKKENRKEKEALIDDFQQQLANVETQLAQKSHEAEVMQNELKLVKEFRRKRAQMQRELEEIKETMFEANREHKDTLTRMEQKFFEEKMRLQQEANQKISELAERAHHEAISNLDETTRSVYKENVRVSEALAYHMEEGEKLKKAKDQLIEENQTLVAEKEMNEMVIREKVAEGKAQKKQIKELQEKVETLEKSLSHVVREFEAENKALKERAEIANESSTVEISKLMRVVDLKTKEMNKVKKLAKNILDQRTEMERFFLEALEHVKMEIAANRAQYRKDAHAAYQQRMIAAHLGQADYPRIRTFNKGDSSTNSVFKDLEAAERMMDVSGKIDIGDLTWEQKERVLRFLFAKVNGVRARGGGGGKSSAPPALPLAAASTTSLPNVGREAWQEESNEPKAPVDGSMAFLTQAQVDDTGKLPNIHKSELQPAH